ncbi:unnamed protein product [Ilex paraguariensis]|uniref:Uncharacterized protein n=1 Tax=Ilex paraguariensis TaxID=185542 RepID=A0ABC8UGG8_9AQUA
MSRRGTFAQQEVLFLGHRIKGGTICMVNEKGKAIEDLKGAIIVDLVLVFPDHAKPFKLAIGSMRKQHPLLIEQQMALKGSSLLDLADRSTLVGRSGLPYS